MKVAPCAKMSKKTPNIEASVVARIANPKPTPSKPKKNSNLLFSQKWPPITGKITTIKPKKYP